MSEVDSMLQARAKGAFDILDRSLGHWILAIPVLLLVTALCARQLDLVSPGFDEFQLMTEAGLVGGASDSPPDGMATEVGRSGSQSKLYVILLDLWRSVAGREIAILRLLSVFTGLLSLALILRLSRDFVAPVAGLLALIVLASNAFYNFYYANTGMYPLLMLAGAWTLWLYLRLYQRERLVKRSDYLAFAAACAALVGAHAFGVFPLIAIGAYHLLHARKDGRWLRIALSVGVGLLLSTPSLSVLVTPGISQTDAISQTEGSDLGQVLGALHELGFNGSGILVPTVVAGLILGWRRRSLALARPMLVGLYFLIIFSLVALLNESLESDTARFTFGAWPPFILVAAGGLFGLYCWRRWLAIVVVLWIAAGASYQQVADWGAFIVERETAFAQPAWHIVSRMAQQSQPSAPILTYLVDPARLHSLVYGDYPQSRHYFADQDLELVAAEDFDTFRNYVFQHNHAEPFVKVMYQQSTLDAIRNEGPDSLLLWANYLPCERQVIGVDTVLTLYAWRALGCQERPALAAAETDLIRYEFYGATVEMGESQILFVHRWTALESFPRERYNLSHQLISADWERVAQLDPPLMEEGGLRQFAIDISVAPAGNYRLMAILYDNQTNERFDWIGNPSQPTSMLALADVEIPEENR
ncbi:MAG: glycosyltransferase family 39 protein [Chloroflexi bacterium]|nr:glycosyltransferase family 39 protein [Chloroflexota bacterium]